MSTLVINAWSIAFPEITNPIRVDISTQLSPDAIVASQTKPAPHPVRIWSFPGLVRTNYVFNMNEVDSGGSIVRNLAFFDIVPGNLEDVLVRGEEQIKVGVEPGLVAGQTAFVANGAETSPGSGVFKKDWRGWEISPEEYSGVGTLIRGVDYSWDKTTGTFALINGTTFQPSQWYTVEFEAQAGGAGGSVGTVFDFATRLITATTVLTPADFGEKLIVEPAGNYLEIILPPIATVVPGRAIMIEGMHTTVLKCAKIVPNGTDVIAFMFGGLYMMMNESFYLYKFERSGGVYEWRVFNAQGNFYKVGQLVSDEFTSVFNRIAVDGGGSIGLDKSQFARLYNEVVLRLPASQRVNYDDWNTGQNNRFYSLANSANPTNVNRFRIPMRQDLTEKNNVFPRIVGSFQPENAVIHDHPMFTDENVGDNGPPTGAEFAAYTSGQGGNSSYLITRSDDSTLHFPTIGRTGFAGIPFQKGAVENYSVNKMILV